MDWIIVIVAVFAAALGLGKALYRKITALTSGKTPCGCSGCGGCSDGCSQGSETF